jgi:O-phospho-L-seryl-tRNASec:L-selenocysteinyl-tRNA synthase
MVPVGGAIVASPSSAFLQMISATYPGRASISPIMDLFITFLSMGETGYRHLLTERRRLLPIFREKLEVLCSKYHLQLLSAPSNTISYAVSLDSLPRDERGLSFLGSMLFQRNVSGCRVIQQSSKTTSFCGITFQNWGSHHVSYPHSYFTAACAMGMQEDEIDCFVDRLDKVLHKYLKAKVSPSNDLGTATEFVAADRNEADLEK